MRDVWNEAGLTLIASQGVLGRWVGSLLVCVLASPCQLRCRRACVLSRLTMPSERIGDCGNRTRERDAFESHLAA